MRNRLAAVSVVLCGGDGAARRWQIQYPISPGCKTSLWCVAFQARQSTCRGMMLMFRPNVAMSKIATTPLSCNGTGARF